MYRLLLLSAIFSASFGQLPEIPKDASFRLCRDMGNRTRFQEILKPLLVPRLVDTPQHKKVREYIHDFFVSLGWSTEWDSFSDTTPFGEKNFHNLIATLDDKSSKNLVLACHFDSTVTTKDHQPFVAATDSAAPCSMLMDLAKVMSPFLKERKDKSIGLKIIFFDGQEAIDKWTDTDSLYGSRHLAKKWEQGGQLEKITTLILLDLLGAENPTIYNRKYGAEKLFGDLIEIEENVLGMGCAEPVKKVFSSEYDQMLIEDDHKPFLKKKVPILHLIASPFPTVWHADGDNESALHYPTIDHLNAIWRIFIAKYFNISNV